MTQIAGKTALVTGGASGIGFAIAKALAKRGAKVAIGDIDMDRARAAAEELGGAGKAMAVDLDVTKPQSWKMAAAAIEAELGQVQILCNNAGVGGGSGTIDEYDLDIWRWVYEVNVHALTYSMHAFLPAMKASGTRCHIVNTASMVALVPTPNSVAYVSSKFATLGITYGLRNELANFDIGVSVLCPGMTATRIVETTGTLRPDGNNNFVSDERMQTMNALLQTGMQPDSVGEMVARSIEADEFYILPSPEWKPLAEAHCADIVGGFRESAQPGHADDLSTFLKTWGKTEMAGVTLVEDGKA